MIQDKAKDEHGNQSLQIKTILRAPIPPNFYYFSKRGKARTQSPTIKKYAPELPAFGVIAGVNPTAVQWKGLVLGEPPSWSRCPLRKVSLFDVHRRSLYSSSPEQFQGVFVICGHPPIHGLVNKHANNNN